MASAFGHAFAGFTVARLGRSPRRTLTLWSVASAILPDIDAIGFWMGIPYDSWIGHRGFTHSILFAALWAALVSRFRFAGACGRARTFWVILFSTLSHGFFDAMTTGGMGVGFFIPFSDERYFFPLQVIRVSPIGVSAFWGRAIPILLSEAIWIGIPCVVLLWIRRQRLSSK